MQIGVPCEEDTKSDFGSGAKISFWERADGNEKTLSEDKGGPQGVGRHQRTSLNRRFLEGDTPEKTTITAQVGNQSARHEGGTGGEHLRCIAQEDHERPRQKLGKEKKSSLHLTTAAQKREENNT